MRSQVRFFMDATDERAFFEVALAQPTTALLRGYDWESREPVPLDPAGIPPDSWFLLIWDRNEVPKLKTRRTDSGWEVVNSGDTIQYLRSRLWDGNILCEGRIAISTDGGALMVEHRYKQLRAFIRHSFRNQVVGSRTCCTPPRMKRPPCSR